MNHQTKRRKLDDNNDPDSEPSSHTLHNSNHAFGQQSNQFAGQGIQNNGGHLAASRDIIITHHSHARFGLKDLEKKRGEIERQIREDKRRNVLESFRFTQMDARQLSIKKAHAKTCEWFLRDAEYREWLKKDTSCDHASFLWIKGKPGAGKSTMMKFLLDRARQTKQWGAILAFFFNARGSDMEKRTLGLYQSLLLQLLESYPNMQHILDRFQGNHQWNIETVKELLQEAIETISEASVVFFIDALDECKVKEVRDMIAYLSHLNGAGNQLYVCFASRHYPHITFPKGRSVILENKEEHGQDIAKYIDNTLTIGGGKLSEEIRSDLQEKASGVFMWVALVIDILNEEYDAGRKHGLRARLLQLPDDLHNLFCDILTRDTKNRQGLLLCMQWVLFAKQPLSPKELYFAVLSGIEPESLAQCHSNEVTEDDIEKFVLYYSKGLAKSTKSEKPTVQFIHESVRNFLLTDNGLKTINADGRTTLEGESHEALSRSCIAYMESEPVNLGVNLPIPEAYSKEADEFRHDVRRELPFLEYANRYVLFHANEAKVHKCSQTWDLDVFPFSKWVTHHNLFQRHEMNRYPLRASILYVLANGNLGALISDHLGVAGSPKKGGIDVNAAGPRGYTPFLTASSKGYIDVAKLLIEREADVNIADPYGWTPLLAALDNGHSNLAVLLIESGADVDAAGPNGWTPLLRASSKGYIDVAKLLIEREADVNIADPYGWTPLLAALDNGHSNLAILLIESGADVDAAGPNGWTPLLRASSKGYIDVAKLLIEREADVDIADPYGWTPLLAALDNGHSNLAVLLIESGADVDAAGPNGWTPLLRASSKGYIDVANLLIEHGADTNSPGEDGCTPLLMASNRGEITLIRLLLEKNAEVDITDREGQTPLLTALNGGYADVAILLIESGADVDAASPHGWTPLLTASSKGYIGVAKLLIDRGARVGAADKDGWTPLARALFKGHSSVSKLLIERGADMNAALVFSSQMFGVDVFTSKFKPAAG